MTPLVEDYAARLEELHLKDSSHASREDGMCAMEAAAYIAGEPHSDHPECACPVITRFLISWNDALPTDEDRDRLLKPLLPLVVGTRADEATELRRSRMAIDWLLRECAPAYLSLTPALLPHAQALRAAREVLDDESLAAIQQPLDAARAAAWDAARDAAWAAAWAAARDAARAAAWDAARAAAWDAAWDAARAAAWDAARDAAWDAARDAAWDAAWDALKPTVEALQASAVLLVRRMCEVGREEPRG